MFFIGFHPDFFYCIFSRKNNLKTFFLRSLIQNPLERLTAVELQHILDVIDFIIVFIYFNKQILWLIATRVSKLSIIKIPVPLIVSVIVSVSFTDCYDYSNDYGNGKDIDAMVGFIDLKFFSR